MTQRSRPGGQARSRRAEGAEREGAHTPEERLDAELRDLFTAYGKDGYIPEQVRTLAAKLNAARPAPRTEADNDSASESDHAPPASRGKQTDH